MAINWALLDSGPNIFAQAAQGYETGRKLRAEHDARKALNIFSADPEAGANALIASGRPDLAASAITARKGVDAYRARRAGQPLAAAGDYAGAAKAAAGIDPETARMFQTWDKEQLDLAQAKGERAARILMAASSLPEPDQRRAYLDANAREVEGLIPPERIAGYDVSDPLRMRADASKFLDLSTLAGKVSVEKFGDYAVTYETNPITGTRPVSKAEIPPTRAERRQEREFEYRRQHDAEEQAYKRELDSKNLSMREREIELREKVARDPHSSPAKVLGPIFAKISRGEPLTAGESEAMRFYKMDPITAGALGDGEDDGARGGEYGRAEPAPSTRRPPARQPARPTAPKAGGAGLTANNPATPRSRAEAEALPPGTWIRDPSGNVFQKR